MNKKVFFCGIGGIGMSALAVLALKRNFIVSGSDKDLSTEVIDYLLKLNINIILQEKVLKEHILNNDYIIFTNAISQDSIIYRYALELNKTILLRNEFLNYFLSDKKVVAITGSHGKTTTTALTGFLLKECELDPTICVGGIMRQYGTNIVSGDSSIFVLEADDAYRSFLSLSPYIAVVTSISPEHFETYSDLEDIKNAFLTFMNSIVDGGCIVANKDNLIINELIEKLSHKKVFTYGEHEKADYRIENISIKGERTHFQLSFEGKLLQKFSIPLFGKHNIFNAVAAFIVGHLFKVPFSLMRKRVSYFKGIKRRYHYRGIWNGFQVFDDYAHHPNEIKAVLSIIRLKKKKVCIFFQPHKYIRLEKLWDDFIDVFKEYRDIITDLFITQVYGVGEVRNPIYNSENLVNQLNPYIDHVCFLDYNFEHNITLDNYKNYLTVLSQKNKRKTILLTLGAGNMNRLFFEKNMVDKKLPTILTTNKIIEPKL